ncbi:MAG: ROK family transcriptional regulator [Boseongicola sp.]|nr:ROK family transcriptional regulator [Boseongicola sp.]
MDVSGVLGTNQSDMRDRNERLVLSLLRRRGALARAEIARVTGLSAQTVSVITRKLEDEGLLLRQQPVRGKVGQPSVPMSLNPDGALFFGLKVGRRSSDLVLVDFLGHIRSREHVTYRFPAPDGTLRFVKDAAERLSGRLDAAQRARVAGLGIAIPFFLWEWGAILGTPAEDMEAWRDFGLRAEVAALFDFPVFLQNDATCACGAELVFGSRDTPPDFLYFYMGYFIGGGVVLSGRLFTGSTGNAGALGPMPIPDPDGKTRQLIDVASLAGLERMVTDAGGEADALWTSATDWGVPPQLIDAWTRTAAPAIAHAIVASVSVMDFEHVLIDGWLPERVREDLVSSVQAELGRMNLSGLPHPTVMSGTVGADARTLGAASLPLSQRYLVDTAQ